MGKPGASPDQDGVVVPGADDNQENKANPNPGDEGGEENGADKSKEKPTEDDSEVKKLRAEAAKWRTKVRELESQITGIKKSIGAESDEVDPAAKLQEIQAQNEQLQVELSIAQLSRDHGISSDEDDYFRYLLGKKLESLQEDEEVSEDDLTEIVSKAKKTVGGKKESTGLDPLKNGGKPKPSDGNALTVQQFAKMNTVEKSALFIKDRGAYDRLFGEASEKGLL